MLKVTVDAVDGERFYTIGTPSAQEALAFLERYDHEGSTVVVEEVIGIGGRELYNEHAYELLRQYAQTS